jgi:prepilin-type N-terminal cleavage/methylation domain-containing protein
MRKSNDRSGFTLIEVLIVISIIGVLSSLTLLGLGSFRASGRDVKRVTDVRQITNALELYYAKTGAYPATATWETQILKSGGGVLDSLPKDPTNTAPYVYEYGACGISGYVVKTTLEEANKKVLNESYVGAGCDKSCDTTKNEYCVKF